MRSIKGLCLVLTFLALSLNAAGQKKENFIGYKHKGVVYGASLPNGVKDLGGGLLSNENYGVSRYSKGKKNYLWLEKIIDRDSNGVPNWIVKDVLTFDRMTKNQEFIFSLSSTCRKNRKAPVDLIVMAEFFPKTKTYKVLRAWKVNLKKEKFEIAPTKGIKCEFIEP